MSIATWKRGRGWTERHGWGSQAWARLIGRQRREARRAIVPVAMPPNLEADLSAAENEERLAWERYEALPTGTPAADFYRARHLWEVAAHSRDELRTAYRKAREPTRLDGLPT